MKFRPWNALASACLVACTVCSLAAQTSTGSVEGRVEITASGSAISNAKVAVAGTNRFATTDESGRYYLSDLPVGQVTLHISASELDAQDVAVTVTAGQAITQDIGMTSKALYGANGAVKLDAFVVQSTRETNAAAIAINEQRTNPNITSVVSADEFGPRVDQNPGEFLKMLPGVDVQYFANNITGLSVRGLPSDETEIQFDGLTIASMNSEGVSRGMEVQFASAADISRVEIRKLPLPQDSANTIGGTINFTRRNAFEYNALKVDYMGEFVSDGEHLTLQDMQGVKDRLLPRWKPNWTLAVTDPVTRNFGFAVTLGQNDVDVDTHWSLPTWNLGTAAVNSAIAAGGPVTNVPSVANPAMTGVLNHDAPKAQGKNFATARMDWRPFDPLTVNLSVGGTYGWVQNADDIRYQWNQGSSIYNDPHSSLGAANGGSIFHSSPLWRDVITPMDDVQLQALWRKGRWEAGMNVGLSESRYDYKDTEDGFFQGTTVDNPSGFVSIPNTGVGSGTGNPIPLKVDFLNIDYWGPKTINAYTVPAGTPASGLTNAANYTVPVNWQSNDSTGIGGVRSRPASGKELLDQSKFYLTRFFDFTNPLSIRVGFDWSERFRAKRYDYNAWRFVGPNNSSSQISALYLQPRTDFEYGEPGSQRISLTRLYALYQAHPEYFQYDQARSEFETRTSSPKYNLWEKIPASYAQFDWHLLHNRLEIAGGARYERVRDDATGLLTNLDAAYMHYANGAVVHLGDLDSSGKAMVANLGTSTAVNYQLVNPATVAPAKSTGAPIFLQNIQQAGNAQVAAGQSSDTGANIGRTSLPYIESVYTPNGARSKGVNDGYFPSINASYSITDNLSFQIGYAKTQARLDYSSVLIPGTTRDDTIAADGALGTITLHNPDLKPWRADNFDARLTWYNQSGGYIGLGAFTKHVTNIIATTTLGPLTASDIAAVNAQYPDLNLGPDAVGYDLNYSQNAGTGREDGAEIEFRQNLDPYIGRFVPGFRIYATSTYQHPTGPQGSIFTNIHWHDKVGLAYAHRRFQANVNWTHIGLQVDKSITTSALPGVTGYQVELPQNLVDASVQYSITRWVKLSVGAQDLTDERRARELRYPGLKSLGSMSSSNTFGKTYYAGFTGEF